MKKIYVIGGTHYDAGLGVNLLSKLKIVSEPIAITDSPQEYFIRGQDPISFQKWIYGKITGLPAKIFLVFCNSLSFPIDWGLLSKQIGVPIVSLTTIYRDFINDFKVVGVIAAHEYTLYGIQQFLQKENEKIQTIGYSMLPLVEDCERGTMPVNNVLGNLINISAELGADAFIFGCTHFEDCIITNAPIEVIYPGKRLLEFVVKSGYI